MIEMNRIAKLVPAVLVVIAAPNMAAAQMRPKPADRKTKARTVSVTISGSGIDWHDMEEYFRPNGIGRYSFVGTTAQSARTRSSSRHLAKSGIHACAGSPPTPPACAHATSDEREKRDCNG